MGIETSICDNTLSEEPLSGSTLKKMALLELELSRGEAFLKNCTIFNLAHPLNILRYHRYGLFQHYRCTSTMELDDRFFKILAWYVKAM